MPLRDCFLKESRPKATIPLRSAMNIGETLYVTERPQWRQWLATHHKSKSEIWLVYYRVGSGRLRISYNDAVEEALCYGWIDSIIKSLDDERFAQRFSARRKSSGLSQMNKERIWKLIANKQMTAAGLKAIAHIFDPEQDRPEKFTIPADILEPLQAHPEAWAHFQAFPDSYKRIRIAYIETRKRHGMDHFQRALRHFITMTARNKRIGAVKEMRELYMDSKWRMHHE